MQAGKLNKRYISNPAVTTIAAGQQELLEMLFAKLAELQDGRIKTVNPKVAEILRTELNLLWNILGEDVPEEYWEQIEEKI